jgi:outer membrane immunogenic protein
VNRLLGGACAVVFALFAGVPAHAGDFKGFYFGFNGGAARTDTKAQTTTIFSPTGYFATTSVPAIATAGKQNVTGTGFTGGGQAGYNFQLGSFVLGFEADFGGMSLVASKSTTAIYPCCVTTGFTVTQSASTNWLVTARPRIGFTKGPVLVYGTGGVAMTNINYHALFADTFASARESGVVNTSNQNGWIAGGGAEFRLSHNWSVKGEYLHASFGSAASTTSTNLTAFNPPIAFPSNVFTHTFGDLSANIYRTGLNFRF